MFEGKQVIPAEWIEQTYQLTDADVKACQNSVFKDASLTCYDDKLSGYKNFWWIHDSKKKIMMARGIFWQGLYIDKSNNVVIATFASAPSPSNIKRDTWKIKVHAMHMIAKHLSD